MAADKEISIDADLMAVFPDVCTTKEKRRALKTFQADNMFPLDWH